MVIQSKGVDVFHVVLVFVQCFITTTRYAQVVVPFEIFAFVAFRISLFSNLLNIVGDGRAKACDHVNLFDKLFGPFLFASFLVEPLATL